MLAASDGWFALNVPRRADEELIPALIQTHVGDDVCSAVGSWAAAHGLTEIEQRAAMLGLAVGALSELRGYVSPWRVPSVGAESPSDVTSRTEPSAAILDPIRRTIGLCLERGELVNASTVGGAPDG
jgi:hypothetical protein